MRGIVEGQAGARAMRQVKHPDIGLGISHRHRQPLAVGGQGSASISGALRNVTQNFSAAIHPEHVRIPDAVLHSGLVEQDAAFGNREHGVKGSAVVLDVVGHRQGFAGKLGAGSIELLRHERILLVKQQVT